MIRRLSNHLFKKSPAYINYTFLCYGCITAIVSFFHEPWRDEAQKWLIARDLNLIQIFTQTSYEGHPFLWYFILHPFASIGLPYFSIKIISWLFLNLTAFAVIKFAPFPFLIRIFIVLSYFFSYEYGNLSVNYTIILLLLFSIASIYQYRHENKILYSILILLLINSHSLVFIIAIFIGTLFIYENRNSILSKSSSLSVIIILGGISIFLIQMIRPADSIFLLPVIENKMAFLDRFSHKLLPFCSQLFCITHYELGSILSLVILIFIIYLSRLRWLYILGLALSILWIYFVTTFIYNGEFRYYALSMIFLIFFCWIQLKEQRNNQTFNFRGLWLSLVLAVLLAPGVLRYFQIAWADILYQYSGSKEMADHIIANKYNKDYEIIGFRSARASAVLPYLGSNSKFWYPENGVYGSYISWNTKYQEGFKLSIDSVIKSVMNSFPNSQKLLFLFNKDYFDQPDVASKFSILYRNVDSVFCKSDEQYVLCKLNERGIHAAF